MNTFFDDLKYGWRMLRRNPGFASVAVLTLALGIGANAAIFSVVNAVLLRPATFSQPDRIVFIWEAYANRNLTRGGAAPPEFLDWGRMNHSFEELVAGRPGFFTLTGNSEPDQLWGIRVTSNFFHMFGVTPAVGRDFLPGEDQPGHDQEVILSYRLWQRRYGGDKSLVGKSITIDDKPYTLVGVLPRTFTFLQTNRDFDVLIPMAFQPADMDRENNHSLYVLGRLKPGVSVAQAQAEMETIFDQQKKDYPTVNQKDFPRVVQFQADRTEPVRPALLVLLAAVGLVLLIACANVANLMLARAASREREIAVRATLGAGRRRILRQLLTESALLALIGGALGILVAYAGVEMLRSILPPPGFSGEIPRSSQIRIDAPVLGFTLLVSLVAGMIFGLAPAIQVSRSELSESLKEGSRGSTSGRRSAVIRSFLVVSEMALSVILLVGAGLLLRSFIRLMSEDLGFHPEQRIAMQVWLPEQRYQSNQQILNFYDQALDRVRALPGVKDASAINFLPLSGWLDYIDFDIAGRPTPRSGEQFTSQYRIVDPNYIKTIGLSLETGRSFTSADSPDSPGVAIINDSLARRYWPNENPVGKQIQPHFSATRTPWQPQPKDSWATIIGVVKNVRDWEWNESTPAQLYLSYQQYPSHIMRIVVHADGDPAALTSGVRHVVASVDPNQPITEVHTMDELLNSAVSQRRLSMLLLGIFGTLATVLAVIGIYGVMAYAVSQRAHEIGIRMALGARPVDVLHMVVGDGIFLAGLGMLFGLLGSILAARLLRTQLYGVPPWDPVTFIGVTAVLALVALAASYFPARRATHVDPLVALRYE
jgi:putative ABC transport system permease protein